MAESEAADVPSTPPPSPFRPVTLPPQPMRISAVLGRTFRTWFGALVPLLVTAAIVLLPFQLLRVWALHEMEVNGALQAAATKSLALVDGIGGLIPLPIVQALVTFFVFQRRLGERGDLRRSFRVGGRRLPAVFGVVLIRSLPIAIQVALFVTPALRPETRHFQAAPVVAAGTAVLVLSLVALCFELFFCVSAPALVVERLGIFAALRRSAVLSKGRRFRILCAYLLLGLASLVFTVPSLLIRPPPVPGSPTELLLHAATIVITTSLSAVFPVVLYHELRETKEGVGLDELAGVFD